MKNFLLTTIILLSISCKSKTDILDEIDFTEENLSSVIDNLIKKEKLKIIKKDSNQFGTYLNIDGREIKFLSVFNQGKYNFNSLQQVHLFYSTDSAYNHTYDTYSKYVLLKKHLKLKYGEPQLKIEEKFSGFIDSIYKWKIGNMNILLYNESKSNGNLDYFDLDKIYGPRKNLILRKKSYLKNLKRIKDSIIKNQKIENLIETNKPYYSWKILDDNFIEFKIKLGDFYKITELDERIITIVRFNCVVKDKFDEILYKTPDITLTLNHPLKNAFETTMNNSGEYTLKYYKNNPIYKNLENARLYRKNNYIVNETIIKGVVFDDGTSLKK